MTQDEQITLYALGALDERERVEVEHQLTASVNLRAQLAEAFAQPAPQPQTEPQFPHIYGPLNREAIVDIRVFTRGADGAYTGTQALSTPTSTVQSTLAQSDPQNPLNLKTPSQMAQELLDATDGFSDALKRYKDQVESRIERADKDIKGSLGE